MKVSSKKIRTTISLEVYADGSSDFVGEVSIPTNVAEKLSELIYKKPRKHKMLLNKWVAELERILSESHEC